MQIAPFPLPSPAQFVQPSIPRAPSAISPAVPHVKSEPITTSSSTADEDLAAPPEVAYEDEQQQEEPLIILKSENQIAPKPQQVAKAEETIDSAMISQLVSQFKEQVCVLSAAEKHMFVQNNWERILASEKDVEREGRQTLRINLLTRMVGRTVQDGEWFKSLLSHIGDEVRRREDIKKRLDLAIQWLYQEFVDELSRGVEGATNNFTRYTYLFDQLLTVISARLLPYDLSVFHRFLVEAPKLTPLALKTVREYILTNDRERVIVGLNSLYELILKRETERAECMSMLLHFTTATEDLVRLQAIKMLRDRLLPLNIFTAKIIEFATQSIESLQLTAPPELFAVPRKPKIETDTVTPEADVIGTEPAVMGTEPDIAVAEGAEQTVEKWSAPQVKRSMQLFLSLCGVESDLIQHLGSIYEKLKHVKMDEEPKLTLLADLEPLAYEVGKKPQLLQFISNHADDAEELAFRFVQILTRPRSLIPAPELAQAVKDAYFLRPNKNARFLLQILTSLTKDEFAASLASIISLPDKEVDEAVEQILKSEKPVPPSQLLVMLHQIDNRQYFKRIALVTKLCFEKYKAVYQMNVLTIALLQLVEMDPIPELFMRTLIQSFSACPELGTFVIRILSRLVIKKVWENARLWDGFIRCIKLKKLWPSSFDVLVQLPIKEFKRVLESNLELVAPLRSYISNSQYHSNTQLNHAIESAYKHAQQQQQQQPEQKVQ